MDHFMQGFAPNRVRGAFLQTYPCEPHNVAVSPLLNLVRGGLVKQPCATHKLLVAFAMGFLTET